MNEIGVKIKLGRGIEIPEYAHETDAGIDLRAKESVFLRKRSRTLVKTGVSIELPEGYEAQIRPRSGNALNFGITVLNTPGTIDAGYRGEIGVILINLGDEDITIEKGDKIAQMVISPITRAKFIMVDELSDSARGTGGFGSTGK